MFSRCIYFTALAAITGQAVDFLVNEKRQNGSDTKLISKISIISRYWVNDEYFAAKVHSFTSAHPFKKFTSPVVFLNSYEYQMGESYLTGIGADTEFTSGTTFWNCYGRTLYNATPRQLQYNASYPNGTARPKPLLRTTSQSRIENSEIPWALGFFGPSFYSTPMPGLESFMNGGLFDVIIPEGGTENKTLAAYDSCFEDGLQSAYLGDEGLFFFNICLCIWRTPQNRRTDFCGLFTLEEWMGFEQTLDIEYYYDYSFGSPTGRSQRLGCQQELLARLTNQYITISNSSVNTSLDNNAADFPLGHRFYADFSHDHIIISVLTSMSLDYLREAPSLQQDPPDLSRHFVLSRLTPFGARLVIEVVGCAEANPTAMREHRTYYHPTSYGYKPADAQHKFIRMRLNNGILPFDTIRGGFCEGRTDGMCAMNHFLASHIIDPTNGNDYDGRVTNSTPGITVNPGEITAAYLESIS
ncbi:MAG: hypothetical protein FE78DRAFT_96920 [Acidomyces sp. 'richmondensis']|nr:MAG: hypothetical protein FE78DRAFT_96920 [Acidomyces sp. 'richmondensis']